MVEPSRARGSSGPHGRSATSVSVSAASASASASASAASSSTRRRPQRDAQRAKVYDAEHIVHRIFDRATQSPTVEVGGSVLTLPVERRFASLDSVQRYLDAVLALLWVRDRWERASVGVTARVRAGGGSAHYERAGAVIAVPGADRGTQWALRELVLLHELAHHLESDDTQAQHGPRFVTRLLDLAGGVIGPEAEFLLRVVLIENGAAAG